MPKVIHLVPYDGIGGVETAARSMADHSIKDIEFQVDYVYPPPSGQHGPGDMLSPLPIWRSTRRVLAEKPDLLIVSLWRSCLVALLSKLFYRKLRLVLFLHFPSDAHWVDRFLTRWVAAMAEEIWADSQETLRDRLPSKYLGKRKIISFVTRVIEPLPAKRVEPVFIFWGRLHAQKALDRALHIFSVVYRYNDAARFIIIGPDGGDLERIRMLASKLELMSAVSFRGEMDFNTISEEACVASFYLQTSTLEGMAMSVVEGMQLGLVPVVTPVGEIKSYCKHGENALLIQSDTAVVVEIVALLNQEELYQSMRNNAVSTWAEKTIYAESILQACQEMLLTDPNESQLVQ